MLPSFSTYTGKCSVVLIHTCKQEAKNGELAMRLTIADVKNELDKFFATIEKNVTDNAAGAALPLIGKLSELPGGGEAANLFGSLKTQVLKAVGALTDANVPQDEVAEAVAGAIDKKIAGVTAVKTPAGGVDITFATEQSRNTGTAELDIGKSVGDFFDFKADTGAAVTAALNATLSFSANGDLSLKNQVAPELAVNVSSSFSRLLASAPALRAVEAWVCSVAT
jgi:hypothetical protein